MINVMMLPDAVDLSAELAQLKADINANTNAKTSDVETLVSLENDATQVVLADMSTGDDLNANTANVNTHTSSKADEVKGHVDTALAALDGGGDPFKLKAYNLLNHYGEVDDISYKPIEDVDVGVWGVMLERNGSGVIVNLTTSRCHAIRIWIDGVLSIEKQNSSATNTAYVAGSNQTIKLPYFTYEQSIKIEVNQHASVATAVSTVAYHYISG